MTGARNAERTAVSHDLPASPALLRMLEGTHAPPRNGAAACSVGRQAATCNTSEAAGEPPYSAGQDSANDNNQNEKYPHLDAAIRDTYAARSTATLKNSLYDSYIRAIKWATLRIKDRGVIAFVTNGGFLDSNTADGMRLALADEFSTIHVCNLRGNQRTAGEQSRKEGGKVFDAGSRATVAITILVKDPTKTGPVSVHYTDIGDYLTRDDKLRKIADACGLTGLEPVTQLIPNEHGDWLNQRRDDFGTFLPLGNKDGGPAAFGLFTGGLKTNRDFWVYNSSQATVASSMRLLISTYERELAAFASSSAHVPTNVTAQISWSRSLLNHAARGRPAHLDMGLVRTAAYRPFMMQRVYFSKMFNDFPGALPRLFPTAAHTNLGFYLTGQGATKSFSALMSGVLPDLNFWGSEGGQFYPRWSFKVEDDGVMFAADSDQEIVDGYLRVDNMTDEAADRFRSAYGDSITKDDIFYYAYGLLYSPDYRETYVADLKKMVPRIPLVDDAQPYIAAGRALSELHIGYESAVPYPLEGLDTDEPDGEAAYDFFRVTKMRLGKPTAKQKAAGERADGSTIVYNDRITLRGVPEDAYRYMLGSRSAIEWIIDRYQVKTDKPSGIVNDPNDWSREVEDPRYIIDLLARIVTVSLETMKVVDSLPPLAIRKDQNPKET